MYKPFTLAANLVLLAAPVIAQNIPVASGTFFSAPINQALTNIARNSRMPLTAQPSSTFSLHMSLEDLAKHANADRAASRFRYNGSFSRSMERTFGTKQEIVQKYLWQLFRVNYVDNGNPTKLKSILSHFQIGGRPKRPYIWARPPSNPSEYWEGMRNFRLFGTTDPMMETYRPR